MIETPRNDFDNEAIGVMVKASLLEELATKLPQLPNFRAYQNSIYIQCRDEWGLVISKGTLGREIADYEYLLPEKVSAVIMTHEGIFKVPIKIGMKSTNYFEHHADWENRLELQPEEYPKIAPLALAAIDQEYQRRTAEENLSRVRA